MIALNRAMVDSASLKIGNTFMYKRYICTAVGIVTEDGSVHVVDGLGDIVVYDSVAAFAKDEPSVYKVDAIKDNTP